MPVAYLAGNKQLARQVERQATDLAFPVVRFQGPKDGWAGRDVRAYNFGQAIGVMNYWNYFNASPGVEPAGMLILDDVHLLEGPLRDLFTVSIGRSESAYSELLERIAALCPYYGLVEDLLNQVDTPRPPEMLVFLDSAELADEVRDLLDDRLIDGSEAWWGWQRIRDRLEVCCWLVSRRAVTFTPYIPPAQTLIHFSDPVRRLYLSATVGSVEDLQRRLGTPPLTKLTAAVQPRQGDRLVVIRDATELASATELVEELRPFLEQRPKALWLCARRETAHAFEFALTLSGLAGTVRRLEADNGADEPFAADPSGHLIAAGRYDGMDFPGDDCRVEVVPEVPVATSDLEEFVGAYLRDAPFARARFGQRVAQALGRCNRAQDDRAVYVLTDPEFLGRFSQRRMLDALPGDVRADVFSALQRSDTGFAAGLDEAERFLAGENFTPALPPPRLDATEEPPTATDEVNGMLALWREDYGGAASVFDRIASQLAQSREHRAFWLAMRSLALQLAANYGDRSAEGQARAALRAAATAGAISTFFTRMRLAEARLRSVAVVPQTDGYDQLFSAWDRLVDRYGQSGPRFDRWSRRLVDDLASDDHDTVARAIVAVGSDLLGLAAVAPKTTGGAEDARWEFVAPHRILAFEVKLAPEARRIVNDDVEQAEGAVRATSQGPRARGLIVTPYGEADTTALARLDRVRLIGRDLIVAQAEQLLGLVREYRRGWDEDAATRMERRTVVEPELPPIDWLWIAVERSQAWIDPQAVARTWQRSHSSA